MKYISRTAIVALFLDPFFAFAAPGTGNRLEDIISIVISLFNTAIPIAMSFAILVFFWGVAKFIWNGGSEKKRAEGRNILTWGIIGFFLMLSIVGIIYGLQKTFKLQNEPIDIPSASPSDNNINIGQ